LSHIDGEHQDQGRAIRSEIEEMRSIPFSAFWLRSSVVSVLISLISDTRLIEPHDINLIFLGCGSIRQLAARIRERRLGIALLPWLAQPSPSGDPI
jgi:hypothetical protein